jgi:hypothetical protein
VAVSGHAQKVWLPPLALEPVDEPAGVYSLRVTVYVVALSLPLAFWGGMVWLLFW